MPSWRKVMRTWYIRFLRRLLNTTVLISVKNLGCKLHHLIIRMDFTQDLWVKYSIVSNTGAIGKDNTVTRLTEQHIPKRIPLTKNEREPMRWFVVCSKPTLLSQLRCCFLHWWQFWGPPFLLKKRYVSFHINGYYDCNYKHCLPT